MAWKTQEKRSSGGGSKSRAAAWLVWSLWGLIVAFGEGAVIPYQIDWYGLTHPFYRGTGGLGEALGGLVLVFAIPAYATVGALVATLRPKNGVGWLCLALSIPLVLVALEPGLSAYGVPWHVVEPLQGTAWNLTVPPLPVTLMLLIFPDGELPSRRWWVVVGLALVGYLLTFLGVYFPGDYAQLGAPVGVWVSLAALVASVVAVVLRWSRSRDQQRQQLKWLVYMAALAAVVGLSGLASSYVWVSNSYIPATAFGLVAAGVGLGVPVAIGVAVLKYRLYDIDRIINRTLVYGALTAILALIYFGGVAATQSIFGGLSGQGDLPQLAIVISTLVIAALFSPLRRRIQSFIDRRFYRRKYDARKTLEAFSAKLRNETDLGRLGDDLVGAVNETMQPTHVGLWLRPDREVKGSIP